MNIETFRGVSMKNSMIIQWASVMLLSTCVNAGAIEESYLEGIGTSLLFSMDETLNGGYYTFGNDQTKIDTYIFPFSKDIYSPNETLHYFLTGAIGFERYDHKGLDFGRGSIDGSEMKNHTFKLGAGARFDIAKDADLSIETSYLYAYIDCGYNTSNPLSTSAEDRLIDTLLNDDHIFHSLKLSTRIGYHPQINGYKPYIKGGLSYLYTDTDAVSDTLSHINTVIFKVRAGVFTPTLAIVGDYPLYTELYTSYADIADDMRDITGIEHFTTVGNKFYLKSPLPIRWIDQITVDTSYTKGNNFDGYNIGLGVTFNF